MRPREASSGSGNGNSSAVRSTRSNPSFSKKGSLVASVKAYTGPRRTVGSPPSPHRRCTRPRTKLLPMPRWRASGTTKSEASSPASSSAPSRVRICAKPTRSPVASSCATRKLAGSSPSGLIASDTTVRAIQGASAPVAGLSATSLALNSLPRAATTALREGSGLCKWADTNLLRGDVAAHQDTPDALAAITANTPNNQQSPWRPPWRPSKLAAMRPKAAPRLFAIAIAGARN
mmetsp:Transcript_94172/g.281044  ORF Transcript_94172/g.281044 Transcript_94172/m.281044 type:complete len:233 (-) Transcript_94172:8-706(-)